jgi:ATP-dependent Zn protease
MVGEFGMSPLGPIYLGESQSEYQSQGLLDRVDDATNQIINAQLVRASEVVSSQQDSIARLVDLLLERDTVEAEDIRSCFELPAPALSVPANRQGTRAN